MPRLSGTYRPILRSQSSTTPLGSLRGEVLAWLLFCRESLLPPLFHVQLQFTTAVCLKLQLIYNNGHSCGGDSKFQIYACRYSQVAGMRDIRAQTHRSHNRSQPLTLTQTQCPLSSAGSEHIRLRTNLRDWVQVFVMGSGLKSNVKVNVSMSVFNGMSV